MSLHIMDRTLYIIHNIIKDKLCILKDGEKIFKTKHLEKCYESNPNMPIEIDVEQNESTQESEITAKAREQQRLMTTMM